MQEFEAGQVWKYRSRPGEEESRAIVCRVEPHVKLGSIVHIQVVGIRLKNKHARDGYSDVIGHMPYSSDAFRSCVTTLESSGAELPEFEDGYQEWKAAFDNGKAGVWTLALADAIAGMESAMNQ